MSQIETGSVIGPYRVDALLGVGGMAQVWRAWHQDLHRAESLKVLPPQLAFDRAFVARFLNEARTAARLQHPNIAAIHAVSGADAPQPYFAMELIDGGDLCDKLEADGRFSLEAALPILEQIGAALDYAHQSGFIHRDIKPANIMLTSSGRVKVVDFGIARAQEEQGGTRMTQAGMILGTPAYMSPEQGGSGAPVGSRSDLYSLGVIAYEMLCGQPPFHESAQTSAIAVIMEHIRNPPPDPRSLNPELPEHVAQALVAMLAKNPDERPASAHEFLRELKGESAPARRVKTQKAVAASGAPQNWTAPKRSASRAPLLAGLAVFAGLALIGVAVGRGAFNRGDGSIQVMAPADTAPVIEPVQTSEKPGLQAAPDLLGMRESQARAATEAGGLKLAITTGTSPTVAAGQIISQSPSPKIAVAPGATMTVRISTGAGAGESEAQTEAPRVASAPRKSRESDAPSRSDESAQWPSPGAPSYDYPLSYSDLAGKSNDDLTLMRNTIYARYGRKFRRSDLQSYFDSQSWYQRNRNFSDSLLSRVEKRNASLILEAQQAG